MSNLSSSPCNDASPTPLPFECPPEHRDALDAVKRAVGITYPYQDAWIHLFLVNKKLDIDETVAKLQRRSTMERTEFMNFEMTPALHQSMSAGIVQYVGADKTGRPTLLMTTCRDVPKSSERAERQMNMDMWLSWAARIQRSNPTSEVTWLIDQKDSGVMKNMDLVFQKNMALRISKYYPGVVGRMYICNMSTALSFVLKPLLKQLPKTISETIFVFSSGDVKRGALLEMFDENVLPVTLGGKNTCDGEANWKLFASTTEKYFHHCKAALQSGLSIKECEMMDEYNVDQHGNPIVPKQEPTKVDEKESSSSPVEAKQNVVNSEEKQSEEPKAEEVTATPPQKPVETSEQVAPKPANEMTVRPGGINDPHSVEDDRVHGNDGDDEELMDSTPLPSFSPKLRSPEKSLEGMKGGFSRSHSAQGSFTDDDARFYEPMSVRSMSPPDISDLLLETGSNGSFLHTMLIGNDAEGGKGNSVRDTSMDDLIDGCHTLNPSIGFPSEAVASAAFAGLIVDAIAGATANNDDSKGEDNYGTEPSPDRHADPNPPRTQATSSTSPMFNFELGPLSATGKPSLTFAGSPTEKVSRTAAGSTSTFTTPTTTLLSPEQRYAWKSAILQLQNQDSPRDVAAHGDGDAHTLSKHSRIESSASAVSSTSLRHVLNPSASIRSCAFEMDEPTSALFSPCHSIIVPDRSYGSSPHASSRTRRLLRRGEENPNASHHNSAFPGSEHVSPSVTHASGSSPSQSPLELRSPSFVVPPQIAIETSKVTAPEGVKVEDAHTQPVAPNTASTKPSLQIPTLQPQAPLSHPLCNTVLTDTGSPTRASNLADTISCFTTNCSVLVAMASRLLIEVRDVATDHRGDVATLSSKIPVLGQLVLDLLRVFPPITGHSIEYPLFGWLCGEQNNTAFASFFDYTYVSSVACNTQEEFLVSIYQTAAESMALMDDGVDEYKCRLRVLRRLRLLWQPSVTRETIMKQMRSRAASHWEEVTAMLDTYTSLKLSLSIVQYVIHGNLLLPGGKINTNAEWFTSLLSSMQDYHERTRQQWLFAVLPPRSFSNDPTSSDSPVMSPIFQKQVSMVGNTVVVDHGKCDTPSISSPNHRNTQSFPDVKRNNSLNSCPSKGNLSSPVKENGSVTGSNSDLPSLLGTCSKRTPVVHMKHIVKNLGLPMNLSSACLCMTTTKNFITAASDQLNPAHWQHVSVYHMTQQFLQHAASEHAGSGSSQPVPYLSFSSDEHGPTASISIPEDQQHAGEPAGEALLHIQQDAYQIVEQLEPILNNFLFCEALVFALETDFASAGPSSVADELRESSGPLADLMEQRVQGKLLASSLCGTVLDLRSQQMEELQNSLAATLQQDVSNETAALHKTGSPAGTGEGPQLSADDIRNLTEGSYEGYTLAMELILLIASVQWRAAVATTMVAHNPEESCNDASPLQDSEDRDGQLSQSDLTNDDESFLRDNSSFSFTAFQSMSLASSFCQVVETADRLANEVRQHMHGNM